MYDASKFLVARATGTSKISRINAMDSAMIKAGVGDFNLIKVSSILPKGIRRVSGLEQHIGAFRTCVLASSEGRGEHLVAGLAYGFRSDGRGGYVAELTASGAEVDLDPFEDKLKESLLSMGKERGIEMIDVETMCTDVKVEPDVYGCALAILVYLP